MRTGVTLIKKKFYFEKEGFAMFMLMFFLGLIGFVTGAFRLISCWLMEKIKDDRFSEHRKKSLEKRMVTLWHYFPSFLSVLSHVINTH